MSITNNCLVDMDREQAIKNFKYLLDDIEEIPSGEEILEECIDIMVLLLEKNKKYGNSALEPERLFSNSDTIEQLNVRIDDKLSRIRKGTTDDPEDTEMDLIGYLILKRIAKQKYN